MKDCKMKMVAGDKMENKRLFILGIIAKYNFAPTQVAADNLSKAVSIVV